MATPAAQLILACGALAKELVFLKTAHDWGHLHIRCLPAKLHNSPARIPAAIRAKLQTYKPHYAHILIAYADCGTGGLLDQVIEQERSESCDIVRLSGAHCYEFFAGASAFSALQEEELGTFYLTDFLARHFERLVIKGLGLDRHPDMKNMIFGHYKRLVYLAQAPTDESIAQAQNAAQRLGLSFVLRQTGYGELASQLKKFSQPPGRVYIPLISQGSCAFA